MAHTPGQVPLPPGFKIAVPTKDHFTPQPAPARLAAQRSWPNIQGSRAVLDEAIEHLEAVAARFGIRLVWQDPDERGQAGSQKLEATRSRSRANSRTTQRCTRGSWPMNSATPLTPDYR